MNEMPEPKFQSVTEQPIKSVQDWLNVVCVFCGRVHDGYCEVPPEQIERARAALPPD